MFDRAVCASHWSSVTGTANRQTVGVTDACKSTPEEASQGLVHQDLFARLMCELVRSKLVNLPRHPKVCLRVTEQLLKYNFTQGSRLASRLYAQFY